MTVPVTNTQKSLIMGLIILKCRSATATTGPTL